MSRWALVILLGVGVVACRASDSAAPSNASLAPFMLHESRGRWSLLLPTGGNPVDATVQALGHEPNGDFWVGIAQTVTNRKRGLLTGCDLDPEAGTFVVICPNRDALLELAQLMRPSVVDVKTLKATMKEAEEAGIEFDD